MAYAHGKVLMLIKSADSKNYLDIIARNDGLYEFRAYTFVEDEYSYWLPTYHSCIYDRAEAAEADARRVVLWLGTEISN